MSRRSKISKHLRAKVEEHAKRRCEYCQTTMAISTQRFEVEHIKPLSSGGKTELNNLALSCRGCNSYKHTQTHALDKISGNYVQLYNPRRDVWEEHFTWGKVPFLLEGLTAKGRASIEALHLNRSQLVSVRKILQHVHLHPPSLPDKET